MSGSYRGPSRHPILTFVLLATLAFGGAEGQTRYRITNLGTPPGASTPFNARQMNNSGDVVGSATVGSQVRMFLWRRGVFTDLGTPPGSNNVNPRAFSEDGKVVGTASFSGGSRAFLWVSGTWNDLGAGLQPTAVNTQGQVAGYTTTVGTRGFLWQGGNRIDLGSLSGGNYCAPWGMNDSGEVVGTSGADGRTRPFRWRQGTMTEIPLPAGYRWGSGLDINDSGHVAVTGYRDSTAASARAFVWKNGALIEVGPPNPPSQSQAIGVNNGGSVLGEVSPRNPFIWRNGLRTSVWPLVDSTVGWINPLPLAINDRGVILGWAQRGFEQLSFTLSPNWVTRPRVGSFLAGGAVDTIMWEGFTGNVKISFTDDYDPSGVNFWQEIAASVPASAGRFAWAPPDSIASKRCAIKVEDAANPSVNAESDTFTVKGPLLTRIGPDGNYERFLPGQHGWRFPNGDSPTLWPSSWFSQFNYSTGLDPFTNSSYSPEFTQWPNPAAPDSFPSWPAFVDAFGTGACYWFTSYYDDDAVTEWKSHISPYSGTCYGLAGSSLLAFDNPTAFANKFPGIPLVDSLARLFITPMIRKAIHASFTYQFGKVAKDNDLANESTSAKTTLNRLKRIFLGDSTDNHTLCFYNPNGPGAHQVTPTRIGPDPNPNWMRIYVYDSNAPQSLSQYLIVDTVQNQWTEVLGFGWGFGFKGMYLDIPSSAFIPRPILPGADAGGGGGSVKAGGSRMDIGVPAGVDVRVYSPTGDSIGSVGGRAFNAMPDAIPIIPKNGSPSPPEGFYLAAGDYAAVLSRARGAAVHLSSAQNGIRYTYLRTDATGQEVDHLRIGDRITARNRDASAKRIQITTSMRSDSSNRVVEIGEFLMASGDSMAVAAEGNRQVRATNVGSQKSYRLKVRTASRAGDFRFLGDNISLPSNAAHIVAPNWGNVRGQVTIYVDLGNNGTIDDTLRIANTLDVDDDRGSPEMPREFDLGQNFPNPFNPTTRIEYALPQAGRVQLTVHDVLGRLVATLVDEDRAAGRWSAEWDGNSVNGTRVSSGLYFYRIEVVSGAGGKSFTATKKMVLVK